MSLSEFTPDEIEKILKGNDSLNLPLAIRHTISSRKRIQHKLPTWYNQLQIHYPASLSLEQCSSERTAEFKASLLSGQSLIDLTAGFGVDAYFFSKQFKEVKAVEQQQELSEISGYNARILGATPIQFFHDQAASFLKSSEKVDAIYLDPARRDKGGGKMFKLCDCEPNVLELLPTLQEKAKDVLLKVSPFADITQLLKEVPFVKAVYIVSVENECKEVLLHIQFNQLEETEIHAVNLALSSSHLTFTWSEEKNAKALFSLPKKYIYEPNASIMKAGAFQWVAQRYEMEKLHRHTHWYTSDQFILDFPGRCFEMKWQGPVQQKELKKILPEMKCHLLVRNFPDTVAGLRKKLKVKEGGEEYVLITTNMEENKIMMWCSRK